MALSAVVSDHNSAIVDGIDGKFGDPFPILLPSFPKEEKYRQCRQMTIFRRFLGFDADVCR